jgi:hypothetical protein
MCRKRPLLQHDTLDLLGFDLVHCVPSLLALKLNDNQTLWMKIKKFQFAGRGERSQHVLCLSECVELLMMLPGKQAKEFRMESAGLRCSQRIWEPTMKNIKKKTQ